MRGRAAPRRRTRAARSVSRAGRRTRVFAVRLVFRADADGVSLRPEPGADDGIVVRRRGDAATHDGDE